MIKLHAKNDATQVHEFSGEADQHGLYETVVAIENQVWIDLISPTRVEELAIEQHLSLFLPTREDMAEIETSSRLYVEDGAAFMTADLAFYGGETRLQGGQVTFVLTTDHLITIRYVRPASLDIYHEQLLKQPNLKPSPSAVFLGLSDVLIDRTADLIEKSAHSVDQISMAIFRRKRQGQLEDVLIELGSLQNNMARLRDSLASWTRLLVFASSLEASILGLDADGMIDFRQKLKAMSQDVLSLSDHSNYVTSNIMFLLDAALGLINIEQNSIVKVISITSVIFMRLDLDCLHLWHEFHPYAVFAKPMGFLDDHGRNGLDCDRLIGVVSSPQMDLRRPVFCIASLA